MKGGLIRLCIELFNSRNVLWQLVAQQLILRYRRTALGYLWTLVNPLLMMSVMALVFATLFKQDLKTFAVFLFAGMIPWNFFNSVVTQSSAALINNEGLIKKIYLPKVIFPLSIAIACLIDSALSFLALFIIILAVGGTLSWAIFFIPVAYLLLLVFSFGVGLAISIFTVFFRDFQHILLIAMQGLFFLTPILYKNNALTGKMGWLMAWNPLIPFVDLFRGPLYGLAIPPTGTLLASTALSVLALVAGLAIFLAQERKIVFRL